MSTSKRNDNIAVFLDDFGRIVRIPVPNRTKIPVLAYLAEKFDKERMYNEKEVNCLINEWHTFGDYFILRRLLIDYKFLERTANGSTYWVIKTNDQEGTCNG